MPVNHGAGRPAAPAVPRSVACCTPRARKAAFIRGIARLIADARICWTGPTFDAAGVAPAIVAGGEEETLQARVSHQAQAQGVPVNVVDRPALSSFIARSTHRDRAQACVFVTSPMKDGEAALDGPILARPRQIVVISMGIEGLAAIARRLVQHGMPPPRPWAVIENGTTDRERQALRAQLSGPALFFLGEVVGLASVRDSEFRLESRIGIW